MIAATAKGTTRCRSALWRQRSQTPSLAPGGGCDGHLVELAAPAALQEGAGKPNRITPITDMPDPIC
jgi:hypothetical protein